MIKWADANTLGQLPAHLNHLWGNELLGMVRHEAAVLIRSGVKWCLLVSKQRFDAVIWVLYLFLCQECLLDVVLHGVPRILAACLRA